MCGPVTSQLEGIWVAVKYPRMGRSPPTPQVHVPCGTGLGADLWAPVAVKPPS